VGLQVGKAGEKQAREILEPYLMTSGISVGAIGKNRYDSRQEEAIAAERCHTIGLSC
jgi:hypothetical protein